MPLSNSDIDQLEELLFSEHLEDEALDYFGLHGLVCASVVGPKELSNTELEEVIFGGIDPQASAEAKSHLHTCIKRISDALREQLDEGQEPSLPYESEEEADSCLESWCIGFIEGFFVYEELWFASNEEQVAELLLPIMALSGLFEDDEFKEIRRNDKLMGQFETIIADQLTDIYLYFKAK